MAVPHDLNPRERCRLLAVVALVLLLHVAALEGLLRWTAETRLLKPFVAPMYTRLLEPEKPATPPPVVAQAAPAPPPPPTRMRATPSVPSQSTRTLPEIRKEPPPKPPEPVAEAPAPEPEPAPPEPETPVAQAPEPPASDTTAAPSPTPSASAPGSTGTATATVTPGLDGWPSDTRLSYRLGGRFRSGELYGDARVLWQREDKRYQVRVEVGLTFLASLVMTSQGEVDPATLRPQAYEEVRNGRPRGRPPAFPARWRSGG